MPDADSGVERTVRAPVAKPPGAALPTVAQAVNEARATIALSLDAARRPHLIGVAGTGMNSLATLLAELGKDVTGSDRASGGMVEWLTERGIRVQKGHTPHLIDDADVVIRSAAVPDDNPEILTARERGVHVLTHAQALGALMAARVGIGVAGTHGKSTTTALIAHILTAGGRAPTLVGGAVALDVGASSRLGRGPELVAEADEYGRRFLELHPKLAVITGIEPDHLDYYGSFEAVIEAFEQFVGGMAADGTVVTNADDPVLRALALPRRRLTYGVASDATWRLADVRPILSGGSTLDVIGPDGAPWALMSALTGAHNAMNALAAIAVAGELGVARSYVETALASFRGTRRRFETRARRHGVWVVDDYAHHPTAVTATLRAAREVHDGRLVAVFQPHTTHRTAALLEEFARSFGDADRAILLPIYRPAGREADEHSIASGDRPVESGDVVARMGHPHASVVESLDAAFDLLCREELREGTLILTLGAGDVTTLADRLADHLDTTNRAGSASSRAVMMDAMA